MTLQEALMVDFVEILNGYAFDSNLFSSSSQKGLPIARIRDVVRGYSETYYLGEYDEKYVIKNGDYLIGMDGEFNISTWKGGKALLNQRVCKINSIDKTRIDPRFLYYFLTTKLSEIEDKTPFVTVKHLSARQINEIKMPLLPLEKQKRISTILDQADALRRKREQSLSHLDDLMQSVFLKMFGDPILNPKDWEVRKLGELVRKVGSGSTPRGGSKVYQEKGHIFIRSQNVLMFQFDFSDVAHISDEIHKDMERSWVKDGDVLLNITGASIGRVNYFRGENNQANVNQHVCIIRPKTNLLLPEYLTYHLGFDSYQRKIIGENAGATRQAFNYRQIKDFDIMVPPIEKQKEFVETIESHKNLREKFLSSKNKLSELFFSLQHSAFTGQL
jgi:type I restriction enzyme S subunit